MTNAQTPCPKCGTLGPAGRKFCVKCGTPIGNAAPARASAAGTPVAAAPIPVRAPKGAGFSIWWIVVPTAVFIFLSRQPVPIAIVVAIGGALWWGKTYQVPPTASPTMRDLQPWLPWGPALQIPVVFVALGGSPVAVALVVGAAILAMRFRFQLIHALEPWWQIQASIAPGLRKPLAIAVPFAVGYYFGTNAGGVEWTYTLISVSLGMVIAVLLLFTPPPALRRKSA